MIVKRTEVDGVRAEATIVEYKTRPPQVLIELTNVEESRHFEDDRPSVVPVSLETLRRIFCWAQGLVDGGTYSIYEPKE